MAEYLEVGSTWKRWDPHIHAPGTLLSDHYVKDSWEDYLGLVEASDPPIRALGVTDYWLLDLYRKVIEYKAQGRLGNVGLIFPNVELRLNFTTKVSSGVNYHLLVDPSDLDHVERTERFLERLTFHYDGQDYGCSRTELVRLGRAFSANPDLPEVEAVSEGGEQYKLNHEQFFERWEKDQWMRNNSLLVPSGRSDGPAGIPDNGGFGAVKQVLKKRAHAIFSSSPGDRKFWLGESDKLESSEFQRMYGSAKPCIHGSDAHRLDDVGKPDLNRNCWIKGDLTFESLRQICLEPRERVVVDALPPPSVPESMSMASIKIGEADWLKTPNVALNNGLVGVIGARGSGKSALADLIAVAGGVNVAADGSSFVGRAGKDGLLAGSTVELEWSDGDISSADLDIKDDTQPFEKVRYLSQQFVERLCSAKGADTRLVREIERVVFDSYPESDRYGATTFDALRAIVTEKGLKKQERAQSVVRETGTAIGEQRDIKDRGKTAAKLEADVADQLRDARESLSKMTLTADPKVREAYTQVSAALGEVTERLQALRKQKKSIAVLRDAARFEVDTGFAQGLTELQRQHPQVGLDSDAWGKFLHEYRGDVFAALDAQDTELDKEISRISGEEAEVFFDEQACTFLKPNVLLGENSFARLSRESEHLRKKIDIDTHASMRLKVATDRVRKLDAQLRTLRGNIALAKEADEKIKDIDHRRYGAYASYFEGLEDQEAALRELYRPLESRLSGSAGSLGRLRFRVKRHVDVAQWAEKGESLIDRTRESSFRGVGSLTHIATVELLDAWRKGQPEQVTSALQTFIHKYREDLRKASPRDVDLDDPVSAHRWGAQISDWLYSTDHIRLAYTLEYDGQGIEVLSPGTRGIVLLLLYLDIDEHDNRPLIIDQPEENLDPQSIYSELVPLFRKARHRRQVIIVTHNANLIVNTDVDQVIIARSEVVTPGELPEITYTSGSLENPTIRQSVCEILEGGEKAFKDRARRLRVALP